MPVNDYGVRADIICAPEGVFNRMNLSQLYEQFLNCASEVVIRNIKQIINSENDFEKAYSYFIEYINDVNPEYAKSIEEVCVTAKKRQVLIYTIIKNEMIILIVPPFLDVLSPEWAVMISEKYGVKATPVEYNLRDENGKLIRRVRTIRDIWIGKKYVYMLCKIPYARSCGISHVNQWKTPIRIKSSKHKAQYPVGLTPIRVGEDENRNIMMVAGTTIAFRILSLYANSPEAIEELGNKLLTDEHPTRLTWVDMSERQLQANNQMIKVTKHMLQTVGIDSTDPLIKEDEKSLYEYPDVDDTIKSVRKRRSKKELLEERNNLIGTDSEEDDDE